MTLVEARERIGGRVWTVREPGLAVPIELGAEFVHGLAAPVYATAREAGLAVIDVAGRRWAGGGAGLRTSGDPLSRVARVLGRLDAKRRSDRSFATALARMRSVGAADRVAAEQFVRGFEAADPQLISERWLAAGAARAHTGKQAGEDCTGRVLGGYDGIVDALASPVRSRIRLGRVVTRVRWRAGAVTARTQSADGRDQADLPADAAIITVPLGVLKAPPGAPARIEFDPPLRSQARALQRLEMGAAVRVALALDEPLWLTRRFAARHPGTDFHALSFLLGRADAAFRVWWTQYPLRAPLLVGWCGGPAARALSAEPRDVVIDAAVRSIAAILRMPKRSLSGHVRATYMHDWNTDSLARGAYSYPGVGGVGAGAALARPIERTLYFAGEHTDRGGRNGTVDGAVRSGQLAAERILRDTADPD